MGKAKPKEVSFGQRLAMMMCTALVVVVVAVGVLYGLWRALCLIEHGTLAAVALAALIVLPAALWAGARWGDRGAIGMIRGLERGIDTAVDAAGKVATVKVAAARAMRDPAPIEAEVRELPPLPPIQHITDWSGWS